LLVLIGAQYHGFRAALTPLRRCLLSLIPAAILAYAVMGLVWPWGVVNPLNPVHAIETFSHFFEKPWHELYGGERTTPPDMPRSYVLVLMGLKLPEIFSLLAGLGLIGALVAVFRPALMPHTRAVQLSIALAALLPIAITVITRPAMYNGIRHFVFVLPPLAVAGGLAGAWIAGRAARFGSAALGVLAVIFAVGIALPVIGMVKLHPYEYAFFNQLAGGARGAQPLYMLDYWGLALKQAGNALRDTLAARGETPPAGQKWKIAVCGPHPPARIALGDQFEPTWEPQGADFVLSLGTFYCARLDAPLVAEVIRDGVSFARAYDLRGRTVTDLFTVPPVR
jgi:hypothetical protein